LQVARLWSDARREREWRKGRHQDANGDVHKIIKMGRRELRAAAKLYKHLDVKPLQLELQRRNRQRQLRTLRATLNIVRLASESGNRKTKKHGKKAIKYLSKFVQAVNNE
jgi:hypothetical protein